MERISRRDVLSALNEAHDGFMISDSKGTLLYFNQAYTKLTKLFENAQVGKRMQEYIDAGLVPRASCIEAVKRERTVTQLHLGNKTGAAIICAAKPCFNDEGRLTHVVTNVRDVTEFLDLKNQIDEVQRIVTKFAETIESKDYGNGIVALNKQMCNLLDMAKKIAAVDVTVLIQGESGTGKEVLAKYIHENSQRKKGPFLAINCGAIPENLLESELFGYAEGTFTGQLKGGKEGLLSAAQGGTVFLDEIGDMPPQLQVKLLRLLETKTYKPVGSSKSINSDTRILSATNRDLKSMIAEGTFREDLYYRLNVVNLSIPALRDRQEDIIPLAMYFLEEFCLKYNTRKKLTPFAMKRLTDYSWPGNVRELRNIIERMTVMSPKSELELPPGFSGGTEATGIEQVYEEAEEEIIPLERYVERKEKEYLRLAYTKCGTTRKTAEVLGVNHSTIIRKMKKYGMNATK